MSTVLKHSNRKLVMFSKQNLPKPYSGSQVLSESCFSFCFLQNEKIPFQRIVTIGKSERQVRKAS